MVDYEHRRDRQDIHHLPVSFKFEALETTETEEEP